MLEVSCHIDNSFQPNLSDRYRLRLLSSIQYASGLYCSFLLLWALMYFSTVYPERLHFEGFKHIAMAQVILWHARDYIFLVLWFKPKPTSSCCLVLCIRFCHLLLTFSLNPSFIFSNDSSFQRAMF